MRRLLLALVAVILVVSGCGDSKPSAGIRAEPKETKLEKAYDECDPGDAVDLADGNSSILINGATGADLTDVACLMLQLDTPEYIVSEMDNTTAMMGRQHEEDGGISYDWSYHPDNGFDLVLHEE